MKKCLNCNIEIGGHIDTCPLCQNPLTNDETTANNWPPLLKLKKQAFVYKLQLFIVLTLIAVSLCLDYLLGLSGQKHWSHIASLGLFVLEIMVWGFIKKSIVISRIVSVSMAFVVLFLTLIGWYYGFLRPIAYLIIPILISATMVANFVFSFVDAVENTMIYLLGNIFIGIISYLMLVFSHRDRSIAWTVCLMISIVSFLGIAVFKGGKVISEVQKRMNF